MEYIQKESGDREMTRGMITSIDTVSYGVYQVSETKKKNTKHAARATPAERQVEKKTHTHDTDSQKQANRQGRCVGETEVVIGKAPRLGIHTPSLPRNG